MTPLKLIADVVASNFAGKYQKSMKVLNAPFTVKFTYIPKGWIHQICWGDLTWVWRKNGIGATGVAGFICGDTDVGKASSLWNPESPNYLAWCGVYIYRPDRFSDFYDPEEGATEVARNIGYKDDITWSNIYGNTNARYEEIHIEKIDNCLVQTEYKNESFFSVVRCQTYLGPRSASLKSRLASYCLSGLYKRTSSINLNGEFFFPGSKLSSGHDYENVLRDVWVARVIVEEEGVIYVIYATSVRSEDDSWNYTEILEEEFSKFFRGVRFGDD
ncbi:MAG: hypothetical protein GXP50_09240 [Deltaproteobacteria bacterium]|nr:hypothetical protein [Deltaproteobacteria bacterium]